MIPTLTDFFDLLPTSGLSISYKICAQFHRAYIKVTLLTSPWLTQHSDLQEHLSWLNNMYLQLLVPEGEARTSHGLAHPRLACMPVGPLSILPVAAPQRSGCGGGERWLSHRIV